jgi:transcriptional regulator with GAF, ATPase, and Fis domain
LKQFRQSFYYRLAVFPLEVPPLRQRHCFFSRTFSRRFVRVIVRSTKRILRSAPPLLQQHASPGNIRELQHALERAFILAMESSISHLAFQPAGNDGDP